MTTKNLLTILNTLKKSTYKGVDGVICLDSGIAGKTVGITVCTHGNEPCGLAVANKLLNGEIKLTNGKLLVVLNNIKASEKYFQSKTDEEKRLCRFIDVNMNRLPDNLDSDAYEVKRAKELLPIWNEFDYALDIHSTSQPTDAMIIEGIGDAVHITIKMPVGIVIRNMIETQLGIPAIGFYGDDCICIGLEAGSHEESDAQEKAFECVLSLLSELDMIENPVYNTQKEQKVYTIHSSVILPNETYELVRTFPMFGAIAKGEVIATGDGADILSPIDGVTILAPKFKRPANYAEEALFICEASL